MNIMDDKIKELKRDLINDIIESEKNPFEKELEVVLEKTLEIAKKLGFKTENIDGDVGYAEYGMGDEYI
ncbi:peptidase M20, partial [Paraclostridium benzoelyticum]|nr:peptidase M20 [Paraclostridium benzoelyticum]